MTSLLDFSGGDFRCPERIHHIAVHAHVIERKHDVPVGVLFSQYNLQREAQNSSSTAFVILNVQFSSSTSTSSRSCKRPAPAFQPVSALRRAAVGAGVAVGFAVSSGFFGVSAGARAFSSPPARLFSARLSRIRAPPYCRRHTMTVPGRSPAGPQGSFSSALTSLCSDCFSGRLSRYHQCNTAPPENKSFRKPAHKKATVSRSVSSQLSAAAGRRKKRTADRPPAADGARAEYLLQKAYRELYYRKNKAQPAAAAGNAWMQFPSDRSRNPPIPAAPRRDSGGRIL